MSYYQNLVCLWRVLILNNISPRVTFNREYFEGLPTLKYSMCVRMGCMSGAVC